MKESPNLMQIDHSISISFRELSDNIAELDTALEHVGNVRDRIQSTRKKTVGTLIEALAFFKAHPDTQDSEEFRGICRLADDAGFEAIASQLRSLKDHDAHSQ